MLYPTRHAPNCIHMKTRGMAACHMLNRSSAWQACKQRAGPNLKLFRLHRVYVALMNNMHSVHQHLISQWAFGHAMHSLHSQIRDLPGQRWLIRGKPCLVQCCLMRLWHVAGSFRARLLFKLARRPVCFCRPRELTMMTSSIITMCRPQPAIVICSWLVFVLYLRCV